MSNDQNSQPTRREFIQGASGLAAGALLPGTMVSGLKLPTVHAGGSDLIQVALVGCGGRGSGAAVDALSTTSGPIKLVAMADVFEDRQKASYSNITGVQEVASKIDVPADRRFLGFDAYKKAMDCLKPGDVVILTTPPAFRWVHFTYAIEKKLNVFMEKPVTVDGPTSKKMLELGAKASAANLKVGVGLMSRHAPALQELHDRIQNGELGEILLMRGYRMHGPAADSELLPKAEDESHLAFQIRHFHAFLWASGGMFNDFYIHHIDHLSWMKNGWPVQAQAVGGRHYRNNPEGKRFIDQNFDSYSVEYTFADGTKMYFDGRCMNGAAGIYSSYVHGTKGMAVAARANDCGGPSAIYKGQKEDDSPVWQSSDRTNPYRKEWEELVMAIRQDKPYNEVKRGVEASLTASMGRMAAHTGQIITFDDMLNCKHEFAPDADKFVDMTSPAPLSYGSTGLYPIPQPGILTDREY
jgi:predicted dehydrogenase